jgi:hypothetical protein
MHVVHHHVHLTGKTVQTATAFGALEELHKDLGWWSTAEVVCFGRGVRVGSSEDGGEPVFALEGDGSAQMLTQESEVVDEVAAHADCLVAHQSHVLVAPHHPSNLHTAHELPLLQRNQLSQRYQPVRKSVLRQLPHSLLQTPDFIA